MATTQYIGARYVPRHMGEWDSNTQYGALDVVLYTDGNSYTAKCYPPKGTPPTNEQYWSLSAQFNQQLAALTEKVENNKTSIDTLSTKIIEVVNVAKYGADNTGNTPCSDLINSLIARGAILYFPAGTYLLDKPINILANYVTIFGDGAATTFTKTGNASSSYHSDVYNYNYNKDSFINIVSINSYNVGFSCKGIAFNGNDNDCIFDTSFAALYEISECNANKANYFIYSEGSWSTICKRNRSQMKSANYNFIGGTSHYLERCNCDGGQGTTTGYRLEKCGYSELVNCTADTMGSFAYAIINSRVVLSGCGCEVAGVPLVCRDNADVTIIGGEYVKVIAGQSTAYNTCLIENSNVYADGTIWEFYDGDEPYDKSNLIPISVKDSVNVVFNNFRWAGYIMPSDCVLSGKSKIKINERIYTNIFYEKATFNKMVQSNEKVIELARFSTKYGDSVCALVKINARMNYTSSLQTSLVFSCFSTIAASNQTTKNVVVKNTISQKEIYTNLAISADVTAEFDDNDVIIKMVYTTDYNVNETTANIEIEYFSGNNDKSNTVNVQ